MLVKAASFAAIGLVNMVVDATIFFLALRYVTSSLVFSNVLGWIVAVSSSYVMNSAITFAAESGRQLRLRDYLRFAASGLAGLTANTLTLLFVAQYFPIWVAKFAAIGAGFVVNFSLTHFVVFRPGRNGLKPTASLDQPGPSPAPSSEASRSP